METAVIVALITASGVVVAALIALIPKLLERRDQRLASNANAPPLQATTSTSPQPTQAAISVGRDPSGQQASPTTADGFIRVIGTSASSRATPRELDMALDGEEVWMHVHQPGGEQRPVWVVRAALQDALNRWAGEGNTQAEIHVPGRTARKEADVKFVPQDDETIEVRADWWIWVSRRELFAALTRVGVQTPS